MKYLADVNVIFPLLLSRHTQRAAALQWFDRANREEIALCRLTRLGVLRLLCHAQVMGPDVLNPKAAFKALEILENDERVVLVHEPDGVDAVLKSMVTKSATTPNLWSDAYLAAFSVTVGLCLVSFDKGFSRFAGLNWLQL